MNTRRADRLVGDAETLQRRGDSRAADSLLYEASREMAGVFLWKRRYNSCRKALFVSVGLNALGAVAWIGAWLWIN